MRAFSFALVVAALAAAGCKPASQWTTPVTNLPGVLLSVWGTSREDVWAVGGTCDLAKCDATTSKSLVLHYDGTAWTTLDAGVSAVLWWVYGFGRDDVWIAGEQGTLLHWDGKVFARAAEGLAADAKLFGVWGASPRDLWAVGGRPDESSVVLRFDGTSWRKEAAAPAVSEGPLSGTWFKVWGSAADDVYLVGQLGHLARFDGTKFARVDLSGAGVTSRQGLFTVAGRGRNDVYAVGGEPARGLALHFDGTRWAPVEGLDLSLTQLLMGVHVTAGGDVTLTGMTGAKFRRRAGEAWTDDSTFPPLGDLHATWATGPDDVFAVGGNFFSLRKGIVAHYGQEIPGTVK